MKLAAGGHAIGLLTLTRGDAGLWLGKAFGSWSPSELAAERATEWAAAVRCVGFGWSRLLRYPDGGLKDAPADVITADIVQAIREVRPDVVCTFGPEGAGSEHDDHRSTSYFAARAFARAASASAARSAAVNPALLWASSVNARSFWRSSPRSARLNRADSPIGPLACLAADFVVSFSGSFRTLRRAWFCQKATPSATQTVITQMFSRVRSSSRCSTSESRSSWPMGRIAVAMAGGPAG